jgi:hypothetical protein
MSGSSVIHRLRRALPLLAAALIAGCGSTGPTGAASPTPGSAGPASSAPGSGVPLRTPPVTSPRIVVVRDQDNGRTLSIGVGQGLMVVLDSTYWQVTGSSDPAVLRQTGQPAVSPQPGGCVPGQGCGTVSAAFEGAAPGRADVNARRTTCGEALACTGSQTSYRVTVLVLA